MEGEQLPVERAVGTMKLALEFCDAAECAHDGGSRMSMVPYFLAGHALELGLKAMLISTGTTDQGLRKLGHDLHACAAAVRRRAGEEAPLTAELAAMLDLLAPTYKAKGLEYLEPGYARLPDPTELIVTTQVTLAGIRRWVDDRVRRSLRSATPE